MYLNDLELNKHLRTYGDNNNYCGVVRESHKTE